MLVEDGPSFLSFGSVKAEPEVDEMGLLNALDGRPSMLQTVEGAGHIHVPNAIVEVWIPPPPSSLEVYKDASMISGPAVTVIDLEDKNQLAALAQGMMNEKAKVKKEGLGLTQSTLTKYITLFDLRNCETPQDVESRMVMDQTIRREFLSQTYGGNGQELFSSPKAEKVAEHGHRLFLCPQVSIHPWAPQMPGFPGLVFDCPPKTWDEPWIGEDSFICIAGLQPGKWVYTGHCKWKGHGWLTKEEWGSLSHSVKRDWISYIFAKPWGIPIRMSIRLRRKLGRDPYREEVDRATKRFEKALKEKRESRLNDVTPEEVMRAFDTGKEAIRISGLNCEHYGKGSKIANGEAFKKRKNTKGGRRAGAKKKAKHGRSQTRSLSLSVKEEDDEVSEYDADRTPPPPSAQLRQSISSRTARRRAGKLTAREG